MFNSGIWPAIALAFAYIHLDAGTSRSGFEFGDENNITVVPIVSILLDKTTTKKKESCVYMSTMA